MKNAVLIMDKNTKKLFRLQTYEKYITKRIDKTDFEVFTKDLILKAYVSTLGISFLAKYENYNKVDFYKLRNFCTLLQHCHYKI